MESRPSPNTTAKSKRVWYDQPRNRLFLVAGIVLFILVILLIYQSNNRSTGFLTKLFQKTPPVPTPTPTPTPVPIAQGRQVYTVRSGGTTGPQIVELVVDPFDPKIGEEQTILVKVKDTAPVTSVAVTLFIDNGASKTYPLLKKTGTDTDGTWEGRWTTETTHDYTYQAQISATSSKGTTKITPSFR